MEERKYPICKYLESSELKQQWRKKAKNLDSPCVLATH